MVKSGKKIIRDDIINVDPLESSDHFKMYPVPENAKKKLSNLHFKIQENSKISIPFLVAWKQLQRKTATGHQYLPYADRLMIPVLERLVQTLIRKLAFWDHADSSIHSSFPSSRILYRNTAVFLRSKTPKGGVSRSVFAQNSLKTFCRLQAML